MLKSYPRHPCPCSVSMWGVNIPTRAGLWGRAKLHFITLKNIRGVIYAPSFKPSIKSQYHILLGPRAASSWHSVLIMHLQIDYFMVCFFLTYLFRMSSKPANKCVFLHKDLPPASQLEPLLPPTPPAPEPGAQLPPALGSQPDAPPGHPGRALPHHISNLFLISASSFI